MKLKMNRVLKVVGLTLIAFIFLVACDSDESTTGNGDGAVSGTFEGSADGYAGKIDVKVTLEDGEITNIETEHQETETLGGVAIEGITEDIVSQQTVNVDAVSGATVSSDGFLAAVIAALEAAGLSAADFDKEVVADAIEATDQETDIVIIGAGGAGLTAAIEAAEAGADVIVLEQMPVIGGNTNKATGGMNASETSVQEEKGIEDSNEVFYEDTFKGGHELNDPKLLSRMVEDSAEALDWVNSHGTDLNDVSYSGGATNSRIHKPLDGSAVGPLIIEKLAASLNELGVPIMLRSEVVKINEENGRVTGVDVETFDGQTFTVTADAVIIATGGFGANFELIGEYDDVKAQFNTTNHEGATGTGILMAQELGADVVHMEYIQTHPTTNPDNGDLYTEGVRGDGGVLINKEGVRFIDELKTRDVVSEAILNQTDSVAYLTVSQNIADLNKSLQGYIDNGLAVEGETLADLAEKLDMDPAVLEQTISAYNEAVTTGTDSDQGRESLSNALEAGPFFAIPVTPGIHHTMGGLKINEKSEVLNQEGTHIQGLYAAGEVTGGVHGGNRIGGNAVLDIVVFGRIAGQNAAEYSATLD